MTLCANRSFCGDLGETFLLDSLLILLRSGSFLDTDDTDGPAACQIKTITVEILYLRTQLETKSSGDKPLGSSDDNIKEATDDLIENRRRLSYAKNCVEVEVGSELPDSVDMECMGELVTVGIKYPWKPVKRLECHLFGHNADHCSSKPKAPLVGVGQSPVLKGSNSFSALALINQENLRIEDEVDEMLDMFDHLTSVLNPELDVPFIPVAKKTRGRWNAKAVLPGVKKGNKGGGCGLKA
ncbi:hypothetical protein RHSIM_Rhsim12G0065900 [Rhododendron simsii]|uniref:Uncharacterized protein n=1 Tax=Rhododendron simsii TaxID=118357 RepID=A0A834L9I4_RHOSS|nr:hypothetical protein RHSIM_Rhsim12G0065900 [Rhododendron simsii]